MGSYADALKSLENSIDDYYYCSFRLAPEKCSSHFIAVLDGLEMICNYLDKTENNTLQGYIQKMLTCLEQSDYVLMRDILIYEIKPFMGGLRKK